MLPQHTEPKSVLDLFAGPNIGYVVEAYEQYQRDPESFDPATREILSQLSPAAIAALSQGQPALSATAALPEIPLEKLVKAVQLSRNIREYGHLQASFDPLGVSPRTVVDDPEVMGISDEDLRRMPSTVVWPNGLRTTPNALDAINLMRQFYSGPLGYDFSHVHNIEERDWLRRQVEGPEREQPLTRDEKRAVLKRLTEVEAFERFLHTAFPGQKRFSIEGTDVLVPMLDVLVADGVKAGAHEVVIGMAHRGRLNVLAHVLGKPYLKIFSEFHTTVNKELVPSEGSMGINAGWTGDVKYHLGAHKLVRDGEAAGVRITLANNPSHLEFVNPVIQGITRAAQEDVDQPGAPRQDVDRALSIAIHGDAAFPGEGVVAETLNLSRLRGYQTGGTVHIIMNNGLGFTTEPNDGRSTLYASDLAKGFEIPVVHVNADDPEACLKAARLAFLYRQKFHKDFLIDLVGYRRWGHNEGDEPMYTQPLLYQKISQHPTVRALFAERLVEAGVVDAQEAQHWLEAVQADLKRAKDELGDTAAPDEPEASSWSDALVALAESTEVSEQKLADLAQELHQLPEGFHPNPKLERQLKRRLENLRQPGGIDWGFAESLAFASVLADGTAIRLTGQDSERGTFSHRHAVLHDVNNGQTYVPLQHLRSARASFAIYNSPLSETAVMGFEYGYSVESPRMLTLWEAQFGDFANAGQVIIDQFVAAARSKWKEQSGLVLLLPHGYEGQGPEHSSARLERYLQLAGDNNLRVVNCTTAAQYFHLLRQQANLVHRDPRPLVVMTPKSLLRHPLAASSLADLAEGRFRPVIDDQTAPSDGVRRLIMLSGKVVVDLKAAMESEPHDHVSVVRIEQLYPFPQSELAAVLARYPHIEEVVWLQEEPQNMGAWRYIQSRLAKELPEGVVLRYVGRPERAATAEGFPEMHNEEQTRITREALKPMGVSTRGGQQ
ncbi:2-oxoglutarate dehydrogenase E1 component [Sulfobacillus harzensis]|uniref:oxoglutarate dehydrogenase (succinyl-transferring) n=1 Tax=Sulfobacillus harzensis TaxID=2729629 RepID=A0A7Y0L0M2_9FIRM|nr:2-oxoglutarate dehydrogenase E1 component [Sulfobacillus harzensis]NMP20848.1 2-oxoglutarate dehydrogenase E1 component [Sulfobacillus harzensis]